MIMTFCHNRRGHDKEYNMYVQFTHYNKIIISTSYEDCNLMYLKKLKKYFDKDIFPLGLVPPPVSELSTGRMDPRVGSSRVGSGHDFAGFWRVGSGQHF